MGLLQNSPFFGCGINAAALFKSSYPHFTVVLLLDIPKSLGTAHEPTAHWAVGCPACGVAVLFKSSYPHKKKNSAHCAEFFKCG